MPNPRKIIKAVRPKKQSDKAVGSAATRGRTGTNINAKGKKVSESAAKSKKRTPTPDIEVGKKYPYVDREGNVRKGVAATIVPNVFTKKTPFVRSNAEANKKLKEINENLSTLRNVWKRTPPSKRPNIVNSANRLQKQKDALIEQLKKGNK